MKGENGEKRRPGGKGCKDRKGVIKDEEGEGR